MAGINPIQLIGNWKEGYALDFHTISSELLGRNEWGHNTFHTIRSDLGQLIYELKYEKDESKLDQIINLIKPFLLNWEIADKIDAILPIPPSNMHRKFQPVFELSQKVSDFLKQPISFDVLEKDSSTQSKNLGTQKSEIIGTISTRKNSKRNINILIIDDLYDSGETLRESVRVLKTDSNIKDIYVLTMTKTRR